MTDAPLVVLDACVLANLSLCDTLLRLAESPRLYEPKWSEEIIAEAVRTLETKLGWRGSLTEYIQSELRTHFDEAWVTGYESLIPSMTNEHKDRHVLAAAVRARAPIIVTFNLRHFRPEHVGQWGVTAIHPESFLIELLHQEPELVITKLKGQATDRGRSVPELLKILGATVPGFAALVSPRL